MIMIMSVTVFKLKLIKILPPSMRIGTGSKMYTLLRLVIAPLWLFDPRWTTDVGLSLPSWNLKSLIKRLRTEFAIHYSESDRDSDSEVQLPFRRSCSNTHLPLSAWGWFLRGAHTDYYHYTVNFPGDILSYWAAYSFCKRFRSGQLYHPGGPWASSHIRTPFSDRDSGPFSWKLFSFLGAVSLLRE